VTASSKTREGCGVVGVSSITEGGVAERIHKALSAIQHRGQEPAGIAVVSEGELRTHKGLGLVADVMTKDALASLRGHVGIGHVLCSTASRVAIEEAQPFVVKNPKFSFALAFNDTITSFPDLREELAGVRHGLHDEDGHGGPS